MIFLLPRWEMLIPKVVSHGSPATSRSFHTRSHALLFGAARGVVASSWRSEHLSFGSGKTRFTEKQEMFRWLPAFGDGQVFMQLSFDMPRSAKCLYAWCLYDTRWMSKAKILTLHVADAWFTWMGFPSISPRFVRSIAMGIFDMILVHAHVYVCICFVGYLMQICVLFSDTSMDLLLPHLLHMIESFGFGREVQRGSCYTVDAWHLNVHLWWLKHSRNADWS